MKAKVLCGVAALCSAIGLNATAADKTKPKENECLFSTTVRDWRHLDRQHLVIWGPSLSEAYMIELMAPLDDILFTENIAFIDGDHDGMICGRGGDQVTVPGSHFAPPTFISSMRRLSEEDLKTVGEQYKVNLTRKKAAATSASK